METNGILVCGDWPTEYKLQSHAASMTKISLCIKLDKAGICLCELFEL